MPKLPQASGDDLVRLLTALGCQLVRQRGSHIRFQKDTPFGTHNITVPAHKTIAKGTLSDVLTRVSLWNGIPKEALVRRLK